MAIKTEEYNALRKKDYKALKVANQVEENLIKLGFKWIGKRKTRKLVHPNKVSDYLNDGWRICKIIV